jgi:hypothetical protein
MMMNGEVTMFYVEGSDNRGNRWVAHKSTTLSGAVRKMKGLDAREVKRYPNDADRREKYVVLNEAEYEHYWGQMVERTNLLSGKTFMERRDTPSYCSPSSEAYWSM